MIGKVLKNIKNIDGNSFVLVIEIKNIVYFHF